MTSVVSRIGTASTRIGSKSVATVVPATFQLAERPSAASVKPSTCEPESPMKTSALLPRPEVEGQEAGTGERPCERDREDGVARVDGDRVDREERERDRRKGRGEPVHVVEQVERVRHADEPEQCEAPGDDLRVDQLHVGPGRQHDDRRCKLDCELADRRQRAQVVDQPCGEEQRDPGVDPGDLARCGNRADGDGEP